MRTILRTAKAIVALSLACVALSSAGAAEIEVYVLTGQSNSLGTTADPAESAIVPEAAPSDATTRFFWSNVSSANATYPISGRYGDSAGLITTLQVQQGDGGANPVFWGPEFGFARAMAEAGHDNLMVIKASRGGGGNTLWSKSAFQANPGSGHMYQHVLDTVQAAATKLTSEGHTFRIAGLLYLQGESDSAAEADAAGQRLAELVNNLRADLPSAAGMHAVVGGIAAAGANRDLVRTRQSAQALANPNIEYFTNLDLAVSLYDGLHFNKPAKLEIGRRFAHRFLQAAGEAPLVESTAFSAVADAIGATQVVFDKYVPDVNGPPPGTNLVQSGVFRGFVEGAGGQPAVGMLVETSDGVVTFGDRNPLVPSSDLILGSVDLPPPPPRIVAATETASVIEDGRALTITFVDPLDSSRKATVASVAFELAAVVPGDLLTVSFLDVQGNLIDRTGELSNGSFGFISQDRRSGNLVSNIHQIVIAGSPSAGWSLGHSGSVTAVDLAFQGFQVVPEPGAISLASTALIAAAVASRPRRGQAGSAGKASTGGAQLMARR